MHPFLNLTGYPTTLETSLDTSEAKAAARQASRTASELEMQLERAMLACEAMWTLVRDRLGLTDVELAKRVNELDLTDGHLDGKVRRTPVSCPSCHRTISPRFPKCMYCGQLVVHQPFA